MVWVRAQDGAVPTEVAPGLTLLAGNRQLPEGSLRFWLVTATRSEGWKLGLAVPDAASITKKRSVRALAAQSGATVAVNGNFFAYGGAAVGAVKADGDWYRLPWKNRTALAWDPDGSARILSLQGTASVQLSNLFLKGITVNGIGSAYSYARDNGYALLTPHFGRTAELPANAVALEVTGNRVTNRYDPAPPPGAPVLVAPRRHRRRASGSGPHGPHPAWRLVVDWTR